MCNLLTCCFLFELRCFSVLMSILLPFCPFQIQESTSPVKESAEALLSSSMSSIQLTDSPDEEKLLKEEIVKSFRDVVIVASREAAEACLSHCNWNQEDAVGYFFADYTAANPEIAWSQADVCNLLFLCTFYYCTACFSCPSLFFFSRKKMEILMRTLLAFLHPDSGKFKAYTV